MHANLSRLKDALVILILYKLSGRVTSNAIC